MVPEKVIDELIGAALAAGVAVRELKPAADGSMPHSGMVRLKGQTVLFIEPGCEPERIVSLVAGALAGAGLDNVFLSPAARAALEQA